MKMVNSHTNVTITEHCRTGFNCVVKSLRFRVLKANSYLIIALLRMRMRMCNA